MRAQLIMAVVMVSLYRRVLNRSVHPLDPLPDIRLSALAEGGQLVHGWLGLVR